jgi:hypothetical protein
LIHGFLNPYLQKKYAGSWEKGAGSWIIFSFVYPCSNLFAKNSS